MQLKMWLVLALVAVILKEASSFIILGTAAAVSAAAAAGAAAAATISAAAAAKALALGAVAAAPALEIVGGTAVLLGTAGVIAGAKGVAVGAAAAAAASTASTVAPVTSSYGHTVISKEVRFRGKRQVTYVPDNVLSDNDVDTLFSAARTLDSQTNCGLRVVCELAATPESQLAADEALILSLFGRRLSLVHDQINSPVTPFQLAYFLGKQSSSAEACANTYKKCHHNSTEILDMIREQGPDRV